MTDEEIKNFKDVLKKNNYKELDVKCCASCKHYCIGWDKEEVCTLFEDQYFGKMGTDTCYVSALGLCDKYEQ